MFSVLKKILHAGRLMRRKRLLNRVRCIGKDSCIADSVVITCPQHLSIGEHCFIAGGTVLETRGGVKIGNYSSLGINSMLLSIDHRYAGADTIPFDDVRIIKPIVMGDFVWGGANISILPGITIGDGAILGLGSVVTKNIPSRAIVLGNPAEIVGYRSEEQFNKLRYEGKLRPMPKRATKLWIPPFVKGKYGNVLKELGYDVDELGTKIFDDPNI